jgi:hypothetical protein
MIHGFEVAMYVQCPRNYQNRHLGMEPKGPLHHQPAFECRGILADDHQGDGFGLKEIHTFARGGAQQSFVPSVAEKCSVDFEILRLIENQQDDRVFHLALSLPDIR